MFKKKTHKIKKVLFSIATSALLIAGTAIPAHASILSMEPIKAGDGFYTTSPRTAGLPFMINGVIPASICTLTAIPRKGYAISAAHCFDEINQPLWTIMGRRIGTVVGLNRNHDISIIKIKNNVPYIRTPIANSNLNIGNKVTKYGTITQKTSGKVTGGLQSIITRNDQEFLLGLVTVPYKKRVYDTYLTNLCAKEGDSGGPIYNSKNVVVGILIASNANETKCGDGTITAVVHLGKALKAYNKSHDS